MTEQEAINVFKGFKFTPREMKAVAMGIKALEKQIPKKPLISHFDFDNTDVAYCPNCYNAFGEIRPMECGNVHTMKWHYRNGIKESHCEVCGQRIDWSDGE